MWLEEGKYLVYMDKACAIYLRRIVQPTMDKALPLQELTHFHIFSLI